MTLSPNIIKQADQFEMKMLQMLQHPLCIEIDRFRISSILCSLSLEHWNATRCLLSNGLLTSSIALLRCQYEALVRSIWVNNTATNDMILKLCDDLDPTTEQNAKNIPGVAEMISSLKQGAPKNIAIPLAEFKQHSWNALNSFTHSGLHAIARSKTGYPNEIIENTFRQSNGLALLAGMQYALLINIPNLQNTLIELSLQYQDCMPMQKTHRDQEC